MENCIKELAGDFAQECDAKPKTGVKRKWYANYDDVDFEATQLANKRTKVTLLVLKAGKKFYPADGNDKTSKVKHAIAIGDFTNGYIHTDEYNILYNGEAARERAQELAQGARVITISQKVDQGISGEIAFEIAGYESGMLILNDDYSSADNSGVRTVITATKAGEEENTGLKLFLLAGGSAATLTYLETNTYAAPDPEA